jgi:hypothetical protein
MQYELFVDGEWVVAISRGVYAEFRRGHSTRDLPFAKASILIPQVCLGESMGLGFFDKLLGDCPSE